MLEFFVSSRLRQKSCASSRFMAKLLFLFTLLQSSISFLHLFPFKTPIKDAKKKRSRFEPVKTTDIPVFTHLLAEW